MKIQIKDENKDNFNSLEFEGNKINIDGIRYSKLEILTNF